MAEWVGFLFQLCEGADPEERKRWFLKPASEFHYLNQSSCYQLKRVDNAEEFQVQEPPPSPILQQITSLPIIHRGMD
jgi:hypothetical protein